MTDEADPLMDEPVVPDAPDLPPPDGDGPAATSQQPPAMPVPGTVQAGVVKIDIAREVLAYAARCGVQAAKLDVRCDMTRREYFRRVLVQYYAGRNAGYAEGYLARVGRARRWYGALGLAAGVALAVLAKPLLLGLGYLLVLVGRVTL